MKTTFSASSPLFHKTAIALTLACLAFGPAIGTIYAASADAPTAKSDGVVAAVSDTAITAKVKAKLMGKASLKKSDVEVTTTNGVVTLNGAAASSSAKSAAEAMTKSVEGVKSVDNNLVVTQTSTASTKVHAAAAKTERVASDSWITTKVKSELLADSVSKGFEVSVKTMHGVVVLKGSLDSQDAVDHVKAIAAKVKGVKSVDTSALTLASK